MWGDFLANTVPWINRPHAFCCPLIIISIHFVMRKKNTIFFKVWEDIPGKKKKKSKITEVKYSSGLQFKISLKVIADQ